MYHYGIAQIDKYITFRKINEGQNQNKGLLLTKVRRYFLVHVQKHEYVKINKPSLRVLTLTVQYPIYKQKKGF